MSLHTMPILMINLGGEMVYILDQRLKAQGIVPEKASKVLSDLTVTMLSESFLDEMLKPKMPYTMDVTREMFNKLAHSSIMRLSPSSMDKLFDLMLMGLKRQMMCVNHPSQVLAITENHLLTIRALCNTPSVDRVIDRALTTTMQMYGKQSLGDVFLVRATVLGFLQARKIKVSLFLQEGLQKSDGNFVIPVDSIVPPGTEVPGTVQYVAPNASISSSTFEYRGRAVPNPHNESSTDLGMNLYSSDRRHPSSTEAATACKLKEQSRLSSTRTAVSSLSGNLDGARQRSAQNAAAELNVLSQLLGSRGNDADDAGGFKLAFFDDTLGLDTVPDESVLGAGDGVEDVQGGSTVPVLGDGLRDIMKDLTDTEASAVPTGAADDEEDLLDMIS